MKMLRVYLDVCSLNRPFDDQTQDRIHLEAEAVLMILESIQRGKYKLIGSEIIDIENLNNSDEWRRNEISSCMALAETYIHVGIQERERAKDLEHCGLKSYDAIHIACAESAGADIFLTTDDDLRKKTKQRGVCRIKVMNPAEAVGVGGL